MCVTDNTHNRIITALLKWDKQCLVGQVESGKPSEVFLRFPTNEPVRDFTLFAPFLMKNTLRHDMSVYTGSVSVPFGLCNWNK